MLNFGRNNPAKETKAVPADPANMDELVKLGTQLGLTVTETRGGRVTGNYNDLKLPRTAPNFVYRSLAPSWTAGNQGIQITTALISDFAEKLRDRHSNSKGRDEFNRLANRRSKAPRRRARLSKIIIDAINGDPIGNEPPLLDVLATRRYNRPCKIFPTNEVVERIYSTAFGWNVLEKFMDEKQITEIMVNDYDRIFIERSILGIGGSSGLLDSGVSFESPEVYNDFLVRLTTDMGSPISSAEPLVDFTLSDGSRGNATMFASTKPSITIRRPQKFEKWDLPKYVQLGSMSQEMADFLRDAILSGANFLTYGPTGSGKTTLLGALLDVKPASYRIVTAEDVQEIFIDDDRHPDNVRLHVEPTVNMQRLVKNALRMRPDVLIVGETRDGTAYDLLQALAVGAQGSMSTMHANSPKTALSRLTALVMQAGQEIPYQSVRQMVADAINLLAYSRKLPDGRRIIGRVDEVMGLDEDESTFRTQEIFSVRITRSKKGNYLSEFVKNPNYMMGTNLRTLFADEGIDTSCWSPDDPEFDSTYLRKVSNEESPNLDQNQNPTLIDSTKEKVKNV
jgi:Flp pilus assembly CpaF family ATPase